MYSGYVHFILILRCSKLFKMVSFIKQNVSEVNFRWFFCNIRYKINISFGSGYSVFDLQASLSSSAYLLSRDWHSSASEIPLPEEINHTGRVMCRLWFMFVLAFPGHFLSLLTCHWGNMRQDTTYYQHHWWKRKCQHQFKCQDWQLQKQYQVKWISV